MATADWIMAEKTPVLHQEEAYHRYWSVNKRTLGEQAYHAAVSRSIEAEIRRRVAAQEIRPLFFGGRCARQPTLLYGIPDAERTYPEKRALRPPWERYPEGPKHFAHWTQHARHAVPVEGCHLCQMVRIGLAGGGPF